MICLKKIENDTSATAVMTKTPDGDYKFVFHLLAQTGRQRREGGWVFGPPYRPYSESYEITVVDYKTELRVTRARSIDREAGN